MPTSTYVHTAYMLDIIHKLQPYKILDMGIGFGRWGYLCRELLDIFQGRLYFKEWKREITGIEIHKKYIDNYKFQSFFYNKILNCNALDFVLDTREAYDLSIAGDILEHFDKQNALKFMCNMQRISKYSLLGIPIGKNYKQGKLRDNVYEAHLSTWEIEELRKLGKFKVFKEKVRGRDYGVLLLCQKSKERIAN